MIEADQETIDRMVDIALTKLLNRNAWNDRTHGAVLNDTTFVRLTPSEIAFVGILLTIKGRSITQRKLIEFLWPNSDDTPDHWRSVIQVHKYNLTKKLGPGVIENGERGDGYKIPRDRNIFLV